MFPFTLQEFLDLIGSYNTAYWPLPLITYGLSIIAVILAWLKSGSASKAVTVILSLFWLWIGIVFYGFWLSKLSTLALIFTVPLVIQAVLFAWKGVFRSDFTFKPRADIYGLVGGLAILYSLAGYPLIETLLGRGYPQTLLIGMTPCPTAVFTLGMLLWSAHPTPWLVAAFPVFYAIVNGIIVPTVGIVEDLGMLAVGLITFGLLLFRNKKEGK